MTTQSSSNEQSSASAKTTGQPGTFDRRKLLAGGGVAALAAFAAACGSSKKTTTAATSTTAQPVPSTGAPTPTTADNAGDVTVAKVAAGLEVLAVSTYKGALDAAVAGKLGAVPPAVAEYVKTAMSHHQSALDAWNKVLTTGGGQAVTTPDAKLKPVVDAKFGKVTDVAGAATLALELEQIAAQTYLKAIPTLKSKDAITLAGSIQIIDQQHQAILLFALGKYPVPDVFQKTDLAAF